MDPRTNLIDAPGPLMIDTLKRSGYQSDSNIYLVHFLKELGDAIVWMSTFTGENYLFFGFVLYVLFSL